MSRARIEVYESLYKTAFKATANAAHEVLPDARLRQAKEGKSHPLWLLGHLAWANDSILNGVLFGAEPTVSRQYRKVFAPSFVGGAAITADASVYPPWDDVLAMYKGVAEKTMALLASQTDSDLQGGAKGVVPDGFADFFASFEGVLSGMLLHDSYHRGQMGLLAKL